MLAWCCACQRAVEAERLPQVSEIEAQIAEVSSGGDWVREWLASTGRTAAEEGKRLQGRREWRLARQSPPKCLECGSAGIVPFSQDENGDWRAIEHGGWGGRLGAGYAGRALVREWPLPQYSCEGELLTELLTEHEWVAWADPTEMLKHLEGEWQGQYAQVASIRLRLLPAHLGRAPQRSEPQGRGGE